MRILLRSLFIAIVLIAAGAILRPWLAGLAYAVRLASLPHLHYGIYTAGGALNPYRLLHPGKQKG